MIWYNIIHRILCLTMVWTKCNCRLRAPSQIWWHGWPLASILGSRRYRQSIVLDAEFRNIRIVLERGKWSRMLTWTARRTSPSPRIWYRSRWSKLRRSARTWPTGAPQRSWRSWWSGVRRRVCRSTSFRQLSPARRRSSP